MDILTLIEEVKGILKAQFLLKKIDIDIVSDF